MIIINNRERDRSLCQLYLQVLQYLRLYGSSSHLPLRLQRSSGSRESVCSSFEQVVGSLEIVEAVTENIFLKSLTLWRKCVCDRRTRI